MNGKEYMLTQMAMVELGQKIQALNLVDFIKCINNAETAAPILDPTMFIRAADNLNAIKHLAERFIDVQYALTALKNTVLKTGIKEMKNKDPDTA